MKGDNLSPRERAIQILGLKPVKLLEKAGLMIIDQQEFQKLVIRDEMRKWN